MHLIDGVSRTHTVRVVTMAGKPWFVAADACKVLDLAGYPSQHTKRLEADDVLTIDRKTRISGTRDLFGYKQPSASLISEVLPSIRKRGSYALAEGETMPLRQFPAPVATRWPHWIAVRAYPPRPPHSLTSA